MWELTCNFRGHEYLVVFLKLCLHTALLIGKMLFLTQAPGYLNHIGNKKGLSDSYYFCWYSAASVALDTAGGRKNSYTSKGKYFVSKMPKNNYAEIILDN